MADSNPVIEKAKNALLKKLSITQEYELLARAINREGPQSLPPFPAKLHIVEHVRGEPIIYEEMPGQVLHRRPEEFVAQQILNYCARTAPKKYFRSYDARVSKNCAQYWKYYSHRLTEEILPVAQLTEIGYTFHRLPWDFADGVCPTWDEMFGRIENADSIMAFIGSFFIPHSDRQQYVWLHGGGNDGKGSINRFLHHVFNGAYRSEVVPERGDKFWTSGLINARVVVFGDCNNYNFPTKGIFKQITGDDPIKIEFKGENAFSTKLICKLIFFSNERPNISGQRSDVRRAIFSEIAPITGPIIPTKVYDRLLWDEGDAFLSKCVKKYQLLCPEHGPIPVKKDSVDRLVADNEEELEIVTLTNFQVESECSEDQSPIPERERWFVSPSRLHAMLDEMKIFGDRRRAYIEFLFRRFRVAKKSVKVDGVSVHRYVGMQENPDRKVSKVLGAVRYSMGS